MLARAKHGAFLWLIRKRLLSLEHLIFDCIAELGNSKSPIEPVHSQLRLALKSSVSAHACVLLMKENLWQEAEAPQRAFLEACVYLMHFTWFPNSLAFAKWKASPDERVSGKRFLLKSEVERELSKKLNLSFTQKFPIGELFRGFSNISVHPTYYACDRCWEEVARRRRLRRADAEIQKLSDGFVKILPIAKTAVFLIQLHLFLQFLRDYLLREPLVPARYRVKRQTFVESAIESWLADFRPYIKFSFRVADEGYKRPATPQRAVRR